MKRILLIVGALLLFCLIGIVAFMTLTQPKQRPTVTARFLGITNDATGARMASFVLSNASPWAVSRSGLYSIQLPAGKRWTNLSRSCWLPAGGSTVEAGSSEILVLPAPTNQVQWRASFATSKRNSALTDIATSLLIQGQRLGLPTRYRRISYVISSDTIVE